MGQDEMWDEIDGVTIDELLREAVITIDGCFDTYDSIGDYLIFTDTQYDTFTLWELLEKMSIKKLKREIDRLDNAFECMAQTNRARRVYDCMNAIYHRKIKERDNLVADVEAILNDEYTEGVIY